MKRRALIALLLLSACNAAPDRRLDPPPDRTDRADRTEAQTSPSAIYVTPEAHSICFAADAPCGPEVPTPCCDDLFCSTDLLSYGPGRCTAPQPDGSFCIEDAHCASGRCVGNTCADPSCRNHGDECYDDATSCCPGLFCFQDPGAYGLALCAPPQPAGAFCLEDRACASARCIDSICD